MVTIFAQWGPAWPIKGIAPVKIAVVRRKQILLDVRVFWPNDTSLTYSAFLLEHQRKHHFMPICEIREIIAEIMRTESTLVCHRACPLLDILGLRSSDFKVWDAEQHFGVRTAYAFGSLLKVVAPNIKLCEGSVRSGALALQALHCKAICDSVTD